MSDNEALFEAVLGKRAIDPGWAQQELAKLREQRGVVEGRVEELREKGTWLEFLTGRLLEGEFTEDGSTEEILDHMRGQGHDDVALAEAREALESSDIASKWRWIRKYGGPNGQTLLNEITSSFLLYDGQRRLGRPVRDEERAEVASLDAAVAVRFDDAD